MDIKKNKNEFRYYTREELRNKDGTFTISEYAKNALEKLYGDSIDSPRFQSLMQFNPDLAFITLEHGLGDIVSNPRLSFRDREIASITANTAFGEWREVKNHIKNALRAGITIEELKELAVHFTLYFNFAVAISFNAVLAETVAELQKENSNLLGGPF